MTITITMSDDDKIEMIRFLIKKMYDKRHFNVSLLRSIYTLVDIELFHLDIYDSLLSPMHCVNWEDMPQKFRTKIDACVSPWVEKLRITELHEEYDILHLV